VGPVPPFGRVINEPGRVHGDRENVPAAPSVFCYGVGGARTLARLIESPSHVDRFSLVEKDQIDSSPGAVWRRAVRRGGETGVLPAEFSVVQLRAAVPQLGQALLPEAFLYPDGTPAFLDLDSVASGKVFLRVYEA